MAQTVIILNRTAGRRRPACLRAMLDVLAARGLAWDLLETRHAGHAETLARNAAQHARLVIAAGGDGTVNEVVNGIADSGARLGILPLGTANVVAHEFDLPFAPDAIAAMFGAGCSRPLWPGLVKTETGSRLFVQMLGVGFDAAVVHALPPRLKRYLGRAAYGVQALRECTRYDFAPLSLLIDDVAHSAGSAVVSKGRFYGGRRILAPQAQPDRPGFQVALLPPGRRAALTAGMALLTDRLSTLRPLHVLPADQITILTDAPAQIDGDAQTGQRLRISNPPAPMALIVPQPS